jgi:amidase
VIDVVEAGIAQLRDALQAGRTTSVELVRAYMERIEAFDRPGTPRSLNSIVVLNPEVLNEAAASDARRTNGQSLSPLDGIPYTAKDSYLVRGMTAASGSPAFSTLVAQRDAFAVERLRAAGAICIGKTNMPPMANGGMQRGLYGRPESPYNPHYLTAPFVSGSSNGAGTSTAASFAAFGLAEETWSSGRGPASNNGLCAYTPSRGIISIRGNWPLTPTMDVVVPFTRTMADMFELLDVIVADDPNTQGDLWRLQPWIPLPKPSSVRPSSYRELAATADAIRGKRFGIPRMYVNADLGAGTGKRVGIGGATGQRIHTRASIIDLWNVAKRDIEAAGGEVVMTDFPMIERYEGDRPGAPTIATRGLVSPDFLRAELWPLSAWALDDFLQANGDPNLHRLNQVSGPRINPHDPGTLANREGELAADMADYVTIAKHGITPWDQIPELEAGFCGLEETRRVDLEVWMDEHRLDAVLFPAVADIAPADSDVNEASADIAWSNGTWVANGNLAIRHLGVPTVTVPMGITADIGMPVGLTIAGRAYDDNNLLRYASAFESIRPRRQPPRL